MKQIALSRGLVALVDDEDYEKVKAYNWYARSNERGETWYAVRVVYNQDGTTQTIRMHNFIMGIPEGMQMDHVDRNGLNNQRQNMRVATRSQNMANRDIPLGTNPYRGVYETSSGRWRATIAHQGRGTHLGVYDTAEEAARSWDKKAKELHGEFAVLNFPEEHKQDDDRAVQVHS